MKSYLGLIPQYERIHRRNNRISVLCITLSVCLVMAIFSMADMAMRSQKNYFIKTNGEYHVALRDVGQETAEAVSARIDVALSGWVYQGSAGVLSDMPVSFAGASEGTMEALTEMDMTEGTYPVLPDEALLNESAMERLGLTIGDNVTVTVPGGGQKRYRITGVLRDMGSMLKADICGMALSEEGFLAIGDEDAAEGTTYRIRFRDGARIQRAIEEIKEQYGLSDSQISENTALLGLMGQQYHAGPVPDCGYPCPPGPDCGDGDDLRKLPYQRIGADTVLRAAALPWGLQGAGEAFRDSPGAQAERQGRPHGPAGGTDCHMGRLPAAEVRQRGQVFGGAAV